MLQPDNSKNNIANITEFLLCSNELIREYLVECLVHGKISVHIRAVDDDAGNQDNDNSEKSARHNR